MFRGRDAHGNLFCIRPVLGCQLPQVYGTAEGLINYTRLDDPEEVIIETQGRSFSIGAEDHANESAT